MSNELKLTIEQPTGIFLEKEVAGVIIPAVRAPIEILPDRAPSVFVLDFGVLEISGRGNAQKEKFFIYSGAADVAQNRCKIMTQKVVPAAEITINLAKERVEQARDEVEKLFYEMIVDHMRGARRRYLRSLQVYARKSGRLAIKKQ